MADPTTHEHRENEGPSPLVEFMARHDVECPGCGYNLRGVRTNACPECGRTLLINELRTSKVVLRRWFIPAYIAALALAVLPMAVWFAIVNPMGASYLGKTALAHLVIQVTPMCVPALIWFNGPRQQWARWRHTAFVHRWSCHVLLVTCLCLMSSLGAASTIARNVLESVPLYEWDAMGITVGLGKIGVFLTCYVALCTARHPVDLAVWTTRAMIALFGVTVLDQVWRAVWFLFM